MNSLATADQIELAVDQAFYNALQTVALLKVAEQTVAARQLVSDQITTLFQNKLRSQLDVSFANANVAQAKLLLLDAQNNQQAALSALTQILGYVAQQQFELVDSEAQLQPPPDSVSKLVDQALSSRPEIAAQTYEYQAAQRFQKAERDLLFPRVDALGVVGRTPYSNTVAGVSPFTSWYGAVGANVNIPIFNGFLYPARSREAALRAQADEQQLRDLKDRIANDVRASWLNALTAYNRIGVSAAVCRSDQPGGRFVADPLQSRLEFDCRIESGAVAADRGRNPVRCCKISVPNCGVGIALPDRIVFAQRAMTPRVYTRIHAADTQEGNRRNQGFPATGREGNTRTRQGKGAVEEN